MQFLATTGLLAFVHMNGLADKPPMAAKPPMGYSSWNALGRCSTEALMEPQLTAMVDLGLVARGYRMFMADCAGPVRAADGSITLPLQFWPSGLAGWNAKLHARGMRAGFYSD